MISLVVDECYAFDYLAILDVKLSLDKDNIQKEVSFKKCRDFLREQIKDIFDAVYNSEEYRRCFEANLKTYHAVEKAKTDQVLASYVDHCNYLRYLAKKRIQEKYFASAITEQKIGYEVYLK